MATSVISLVDTIIKARARGIHKKDRSDAPIELIVRRIDDGETVKEERILRIGYEDKTDRKLLEQKVNDALKKLTKKKP